MKETECRFGVRGKKAAAKANTTICLSAALTVSATTFIPTNQTFYQEFLWGWRVASLIDKHRHCFYLFIFYFSYIRRANTDLKYKDTNLKKSDAQLLRADCRTATHHKQVKLLSAKYVHISVICMYKCDNDKTLCEWVGWDQMCICAC